MEVANKGAVGDANVPTQHIPEDSNTVDQGGSGGQEGASMGKRPMGRDAAKKKGASSSSGGSVEYAAKFHELSLEKIGYLKDSDDDWWSKMARLVEIEEQQASMMQAHQERLLALEERRLKL
ncbi:hypothetical protein BAE44_0000625 [Dichanthelium oligosanthes]|uniref:No apical meristem-associated C-terminal domain-containing protein n=1 Tax=Dichanthelium oligosanthes TaxID=888268 RepID=A0A1E5WLT1_9POAL|nr:hypothetical protein BAE44_0000625 [Dichanthelium oligosanthes]